MKPPRLVSHPNRIRQTLVPYWCRLNNQLHFAILRMKRKKEREFRSLWEETRGRGERGNERKAWNSQFDVYILHLPKWSSLLVYSWWINHSVFEYLLQCRYSEVFRFCLGPFKGVSTLRVNESRGEERAYRYGNTSCLLMNHLSERDRKRGFDSVGSISLLYS